MATITVFGLGPGDLSGLSMGAWDLIQSGLPLYLRTGLHPAADDLRRRGVHFETFDSAYDTMDSFSDVYDWMATRLLSIAADRDILYAVPGHPLMAEQSVQNLLIRGGAPDSTVNVVIGPGQSFLDAVCSVLRIDPIDGLMLLDGTTLDAGMLNPATHTLIAQVYSPSIATDVKLTLMEVYPDDYPVTVIRAAGVPRQERLEALPLYELDRLEWIDHLTTVFLPASKEDGVLARHPSFATALVRKLREPDGCPWDRKQTHATLRRYVLEEAYEVAEAIDEDDMDALADELGDLLLQVLLHAQIASEDGEFTVQDIYAALSDKLIRRHPHVFGDQPAQAEQDAQARWDAAKQAERTTHDESVLSGVKRAQPPFTYVMKLQQAAAEVGFDWPDVDGAVDKLREEVAEFVAEHQSGQAQARAEEFGDLLFTMVNIARHLEINPEQALVESARKFDTRFRRVEAMISASQKGWEDYSVQELDMLWKEAKRAERDNLSE